jgi:hypothetical protein
VFQCCHGGDPSCRLLLRISSASERTPGR